MIADQSGAGQSNPFSSFRAQRHLQPMVSDQKKHEQTHPRPRARQNQLPAFDKEFEEQCDDTRRLGASPVRQDGKFQCQ